MLVRERTSYPVKDCRILGIGQPIQRKVVLFQGKDKLSSERMSYPGERTNYPAKGRRILEKEQTIQRKVNVFRHYDYVLS